MLLQLRTSTAEKVALRLGKIGVAVIVEASEIGLHAFTYSRFDGEHLCSHIILELSTLPFGREQKRRYMDIRAEEGNTCRVSYYEPLFQYSPKELVWDRSTAARYLDGLGFSTAARWLQNVIFPADPKSFTAPVALGVIAPTTDSRQLDWRMGILSNRLTSKTAKAQFLLRRSSSSTFILKDNCQAGHASVYNLGRNDAERYLRVFGFDPWLINLAFP